MGCVTLDQYIYMPEPCQWSDTAASTAHNHPSHKSRWNSELDDSFVVFPGPIHSYLNLLLPASPDHPMPHYDVSGAFDAVPETRHESNMYEPLTEGFNRIMSSLPEEKRIVAINTHAKRIPVPFPKLEEALRNNGPDVSFGCPGEDKSYLESNLIWSNIGTVGEIKATKVQDPMSMPRKSTTKERGTAAARGLAAVQTKDEQSKNSAANEGGSRSPLTEAQTRQEVKRQLAINARNLMHAHTHSFAFVIGIYGYTARIFRFDHAGCIASPSFNYRESPEIFRIFFWRFVHPKTGHSIVGADPTVSRPTEDDWSWASQVLRERYNEELSEEARTIGRWFEIPTVDGDYDARLERFLAIDLRFVNSTLFGRATTAWITLKRTQDNDPEDGLRYAVKDSWRQLIRPPETVHLNHLQKHCGPELFGLTNIDVGGDLRLWEDEVWLNTLSTSGLVYQTFGNLVQIDGVIYPPEIAATLRRGTYHTTISARLANKSISHERGHMRFATKCVGRPLSTFTSTRELVTAIRDAVIGHRCAWESGILHRDISAGNVLIVEEHMKKPFEGFLTDFDYSSIKPGATTPNDEQKHALTLAEARLKQRTGTYHFMAIELLRTSGVKHEVRHDLESFYWLVLWITLNHASYSYAIEQPTPWTIFSQLNNAAAGNAKLGWLSCDAKTLHIPGNPPLTRLQIDWAKLCISNAWSLDPDPERALDHENVLKILNAALEGSGWPDNDAAKISVLPLDSDTSNPVKRLLSTTKKRASTTDHDVGRTKRARPFTVG